MATELAQYRESIAEAPAFPRAEYESRFARARQAMADDGVDVMVLFDPQSVCYFTGYSSVNVWDNSCVVVSLNAPLRIVIWDFEMGRFQATGELAEPVTYPSFGDFVATAVKAIGLEGAAERRIVTDRWAGGIAPEAADRLAAALGVAELGSAHEVLWKTRLIKSDAEIQMLRRSAATTDAGLAAAAAAVREGVSDREIAAAGAAAMLEAGSGHFSIQPIVTIGPRAGVPHSESSGRTLGAGECVFLEFGSSVHRYTAPAMRTVVIGEPSPDIERLARLTSAAVEAALRAIRPGAACADVAQAVSRTIDESDLNVLYHGYSGYPVGISFPPSWLENLQFHIVPGNARLLEPGMAFHLPISLRIPGRMGVGLSYTIVVNTESAEILTGTKAELIVK